MIKGKFEIIAFVTAIVVCLVIGCSALVFLIKGHTPQYDVPALIDPIATPAIAPSDVLTDTSTWNRFQIVGFGISNNVSGNYFSYVTIITKDHLISSINIERARIDSNVLSLAGSYLYVDPNFTNTSSREDIMVIRRQ